MCSTDCLPLDRGSNSLGIRLAASSFWPLQHRQGLKALSRGGNLLARFSCCLMPSVSFPLLTFFDWNFGVLALYIILELFILPSLPLFLPLSFLPCLPSFHCVFVDIHMSQNVLGHSPGSVLSPTSEFPGIKLGSSSVFCADPSSFYP